VALLIAFVTFDAGVTTRALIFGTFTRDVTLFIAAVAGLVILEGIGIGSRSGRAFAGHMAFFIAFITGFIIGVRTCRFLVVTSTAIEAWSIHS